MNALTFFIGVAIVFLAVDLSCGRAQLKENPEKVRVPPEPKKWQAARERNVHSTPPPPGFDHVEETGDPEDKATDVNPQIHVDTPVLDDVRSDAKDTKTAGDKAQDNSEGEPVEQPKIDDSQDSKYGSGSVCGYCSYCKFCKLCETGCPCETNKESPNCQLCKYCKYCRLCSVCGTVCTPGGFLDIFSSSIYSSLPSLDKKTKEKVDKDIENARDFIKEYL